MLLVSKIASLYKSSSHRKDKTFRETVKYKFVFHYIHLKFACFIYALCFSPIHWQVVVSLLFLAFWKTDEVSRVFLKEKKKKKSWKV